MNYGSPVSTEGESSSVCLQILEPGKQPKKLSSSCGSTMFEPRRENSDTIERTDSNKGSSASSSTQSLQTDLAPEKKLTLFALRLAVLEKSASGLGTLGFIWATVVLLGGFAITLEKNDFWFITTILLIEGARIFSRSHELEWQHQATWSLADAGKLSFRALKSSSNFVNRTLTAIFRHFSAVGKESHRTQRTISTNPTTNDPKTRTWLTPDVPLLPYTGWVFLSKNISRLLYWLQLVSALACVTLSLMRLIQQDFGEISKGDSDKRNRKSALNIFYGLALAEALLFLMEKTYWEFKVSYCKLIDEVNSECGFGNTGLVSTKRFFYDAYSRCVNGSIFDGLKMDLVSFSAELLLSDSSDEQLTGARILRKFVNTKRFSDYTLRKIGTSIPVMERLVEMLNWNKSPEAEIRKSAAEILSKLAGKKQNCLRVAGIPGAMESISSLLYTGPLLGKPSDEICQKNVVVGQEQYEFSTFNLLGLLILKNLARDHDNCGKIGSSRGLLPKIIDFTHAGERILKDNHVTECQITTVKRSLQLVKMLVSASGPTGKYLRQEISENVFTISNIREILQYGGNHRVLQKLGIEILTSLALDEDAKERIGRTGGVLKELVGIFMEQGLPENQNSVRMAAGEALAMLALESEMNCDQILSLEVLEKFVEALKDPVLRVNSARILRNLCAYSGSNSFHLLKGVTSATPTVLAAIMSEEIKLQEVAIGLAAQILRFKSSRDSDIELEQSGITETELAAKLVQILEKYQCPSTKVPRIRRFAIELAIWMMKYSKKSVQIFKEMGMEMELKSVVETTSELECFNVFSGSVGLSRHTKTVHSLVDTALRLLTHG